MIKRPSGLYDTYVTVAVWPVSGNPICVPVYTSHILIVLSAEEETMESVVEAAEEEAETIEEVVANQE